MGYVETRSFETSLQKILKRWAQKVTAHLKKAEQIKAEVDKLRAKQDRTPEEEKLLARCEAALRKLQKEVEKATASLELELKLLTPPPEAKKSDFAKIKKIVKDAVAKVEKGLPLGGGFRLKPDVEIDWKKQKFKKLGVTLEWTF